MPTVKANIPDYFNNSITVSDMDQLVAAMRDRNVEQIVLNNNIYARGHGAYNINNYGIARTLEITSAKNKRYSLNMGDRFFNLSGANQRGTGAQGWNLIVKNVDVNSDNYYNSPFNSLGVSVADSKQDTLTYSDVNFNGHEFARMDAFNIVLDGKVNVNSILEGGNMSAVTAYSFKVTDGANVVMNVRQDSRFNHGTTEFLWSNAAVKTFYNNSNDAVVIGSGASFELNPDQAVYNTKGFSFSDKANMIIAENANVEMNMGQGNSVAILAPRQLIVKKVATLNIKTQEDNNGSYAWGDDNNGNHVAPISIGNLKAADGDSSFTIENGATVRVVRTATDRNSYGPMISFGSTGENPYCTYYFNVEDGATLDLQDAGQAGSWHHQGTEWESNYLGDKSQLPLNGMIVTYGIRSEDHLNFGNVKYVNLQRSGRQHGLLIRLEGGHNISGSNAATINGQDIPLAQWQAGNHSKKADFTWYINGLKTENKMGNWAYDYNIKGRRPGDVPNRREANTDYHFDQTIGTVFFADGQDLSKHQNFNNNFSWWKAQRISFGSDLLPDSKKYGVTSAAAFETHVNAEVNKSNELELTAQARKNKFNWTDLRTGKKIAAPAGVKDYWSVVPNTSKATTAADPNTSGQITLKNVPVIVLTANAGKVGKARAGHAEDMPTVAYNNIFPVNNPSHNVFVNGQVYSLVDNPDQIGDKHVIIANIANYQVAKVNFIDNASNQLVSTYQIIDKVPTDWTWSQHA